MYVVHRTVPVQYRSAPDIRRKYGYYIPYTYSALDFVSVTRDTLESFYAISSHKDCPDWVLEGYRNGSTTYTNRSILVGQEFGHWSVWQGKEGRRSRWGNKSFCCLPSRCMKSRDWSIHPVRSHFKLPNDCLVAAPWCPCADDERKFWPTFLGCFTINTIGRFSFTAVCYKRLILTVSLLHQYPPFHL